MADERLSLFRDGGGSVMDSGPGRPGPCALAVLSPRGFAR
jgi:hypothetical protein